MSAFNGLIVKNINHFFSQTSVSQPFYPLHSLSSFSICLNCRIPDLFPLVSMEQWTTPAKWLVVCVSFVEAQVSTDIKGQRSPDFFALQIHFKMTSWRIYHHKARTQHFSSAGLPLTVGTDCSRHAHANSIQHDHMCNFLNDKWSINTSFVILW